uniref:Uncharacterized protein n=1 Tax=Araucaria cunninghamii TaxID=56994 RepID=A0A0D6R3S4_ARACU
MEVNPAVNHVSAKRFWNVLRIAFFMIRKGLISKRRMLMDMHVMMKRGKVYGKSLGNLMFHHSRGNNHGVGLREYEFSCSNSPAPVLFHVPRKKFQIHMPHFPCIHPHPIEEDKEEDPNAFVFPQLDYNGEYFTKDCLDQKDLPGPDKLSPMLSPLSRRISIYSEDEDNDHRVDRQAEEFIARFYEQLRMQQQVSMVQYQEMLARGAN